MTNAADHEVGIARTGWWHGRTVLLIAFVAGLVVASYHQLVARFPEGGGAAAYKAALRRDDGALGMPRGVAALGFALCALLALSLDVAPTLAAVGRLVLAVVVRAAVRRRRA